jgi:DNA repair protein RecO (recombination protein O)
MQLFDTKGIVLRAVKYGETSLVVTLYTELFGVQSYLVNGVRSHSRKGPGRANLFQPAAILDLVAYHNELKNLQRLRDFKWGYLYQHIFFNVLKNAVALFMVELLQKCLKQPEPNPDLFYFIEDAFIHLDDSGDTMVANYPLFFALQLAAFLGFRIQDNPDQEGFLLDLREGLFVPAHPMHHDVLEPPLSTITAQLLKVRMPSELKDIPLNQETRRLLLQAYQAFYALHVPDFGVMKTLPVLQAVI